MGVLKYRRGTTKRAARRAPPHMAHRVGHEGRFDHVHTLVSAGRVVRLALPHDGNLELAGVRSTVGGTLAAAIKLLEAASAEYDVMRLERPVRTLL